MSEFVAYELKCNINNKSYIGITNNLSGRWNKHVYDAKHNSPCVIHRAMRKYGIENFTIIQLKECSSKEELCKTEQNLILSLKTHVSNGGYNETFGGEAPMLGRKHTTESKILISKKLKGRTSPNKGRKSSKETRKIMSEKHSKSVLQLDLNGNVIAVHKSIIAAGLVVGIAGSNISGVCRNKKKTAGGYCWQYSEGL